jgi:hypothetical protein
MNEISEAPEVSCCSTCDKADPVSERGSNSDLKRDGAGPQPVDAAVFQSYCEWFTRNFSGIEAGMERIEPNGGRVVEFQGRPLVAMRARVGVNAVRAIELTFATNDHTRVFDLTGVRAIQLERDGAGFPKLLELACDTEKIVLHFTGTAQAAPTYSRNSWGE